MFPLLCVVSRLLFLISAPCCFLRFLLLVSLLLLLSSSRCSSSSSSSRPFSFSSRPSASLSSLSHPSSSSRPSPPSPNPHRLTPAPPRRLPLPRIDSPFSASIFPPSSRFPFLLLLNTLLLRFISSHVLVVVASGCHSVLLAGLVEGMGR